VLLCGARGQAKELIEQSGLAEHVGRENVLDNFAESLERAKAIHAAPALAAVHAQS
jgi:hypothetical protein